MIGYRENKTYKTQRARMQQRLIWAFSLFLINLYAGKYTLNNPSFVWVTSSVMIVSMVGILVFAIGVLRAKDLPASAVAPRENVDVSMFPDVVAKPWSNTKLVLWSTAGIFGLLALALVTARGGNVNAANDVAAFGSLLIILVIAVVLIRSTRYRRRDRQATLTAFAQNNNFSLDAPIKDLSLVKEFWQDSTFLSNKSVKYSDVIEGTYRSHPIRIAIITESLSRTVAFYGMVQVALPSLQTGVRQDDLASCQSYEASVMQLGASYVETTAGSLYVFMDNGIEHTRSGILRLFLMADEMAEYSDEIAVE